MRFFNIISLYSPYQNFVHGHCGMYIYHYVITLGLRSKYDVLGHYFISAAQILAYP